VVATSLAELEEERRQVEDLRRAASELYESGEESKFNRMLEAFRDPQFAQEKFLIFTEHRDTLEYIVTRLKGLGYQDQVTSIHGGWTTGAGTAGGVSSAGRRPKAGRATWFARMRPGKD
jgi:ERCC4-related helicase